MGIIGVPWLARNCGRGADDAHQRCKDVRPIVAGPLEPVHHPPGTEPRRAKGAGCRIALNSFGSRRSHSFSGL